MVSGRDYPRTVSARSATVLGEGQRREIPMNEEKDREETAVEETVVLENEAIETDGTAEPETSADAAENAEADRGCNEDESPEPKKPTRKKAAIVAAAACLAFAVGGVAVMSANHTAQPVAKEQKAKASKKSKEAVETAEATIRVTAEGLTSDSSAVITHWTGDGEGTRGTEFYHATTAEAAPQGTDRVEVAVGSWKVEVLPSVNADGSINEGTAEAVEVEVRADETSTVDRGVTTTPADQVTQDRLNEVLPSVNADGSINEGTAEAVEVEVRADETSTVDRGVTTTPADQVTQDRLNEVLDEVNVAVTKGDKTLTGDAGTEVVNKATDNASKNPNADAAQIEQKREEGTGAAQEAKPQETAPAKQDTGTSSSSNSSSGKSDSGKQAESQKTDSNKGNSSSSGSSSSSGGSSSIKAECSHNWVAQTTTSWVQDTAAYDEQVCTSAAWDEQVVVGEEMYFVADGYVISSNADAAEHSKMLALSGMSTQAKSRLKYATVHHDAEYTTVHHDATGHNETVTTGYRCSKCGASK